MEQTTEFEYERFWNEDQRPRRSAGDPDDDGWIDDGWVDDDILEAPAPPWVRLVSRRDPFPPCGELATWPKNYPVGELADLSEAEAAEEDPDRFVFSDGEMEAWVQIVGDVVDGADSFVRGGASFFRDEKEAPIRGPTEVEDMAKQNQGMDTGKESNGDAQRAPPIWKTAAGGVQLAIWKNNAPRGGSFRTVTLDRRFKRTNGEWGSTASFRMNDIPKAIVALQKAYEQLVCTGDSDEDPETAPIISVAPASQSSRVRSFDPQGQAAVLG